jgi:hypothetical protein
MMKTTASESDPEQPAQNSSVSVATDPREVVVNVSHFQTVYDTAPKAAALRLESLLGTTHQIVHTKESVALWNPTNFIDGGTRCINDVNLISLLMLDADHLTNDEAALLHKMLRCFAHVAYTSFNHCADPSEHRLRFAILLSRSVNVIEYQELWRGITPALRVAIDPTSKNPSQPYYLPACPENRAHLAYINYNTGVRLNVDLALANRLIRSTPQTGALPKSNKAAWQARRSGALSEINKIGEFCPVVASILREIRESKTCKHLVRRDLARMMNALGIPEAEAVSLYAGQANYCEAKTRRQLQSLRYPPSCKKLAEDHRLCSGECENAKKVNAWSPIFLLKNKK